MTTLPKTAKTIEAETGQAVFAFAKGTRQLGATIIRNCRVTNTCRQAKVEWLVKICVNLWLYYPR